MRITLLQWNVWYLEKIDEILRVIAKISPDVLCLQELSTNTDANPDISTGEVIRNEFGLNAHMKVAQTWEGWHKDSQENGIFSRFPLIENVTRYVRDPHPPNTIDYAREGRVYLESTLELGEKTLHVGTTHMSYAHRFEPSEERRVEDRQLLNFLDRDENFVFAADLNTHSETDLVRSLMSKYQHAGPPLDHNTWTTKPFDYNGFREEGLNWRLDYVFTSNDVKVVRSEVVNTNVSDHLPLLIEIEM
jgi:endonuclease/exonuclease/phosphatase family metal-dependent hydrolase